MPKINLQVLKLSNTNVDCITGGLERASDIRVDTSDKIMLYNNTLKSFELSTKHLIQLLCPNDDESGLLTILHAALTDPYQNLRQFISEKVSFPLSFLTYNWNTILCNLPSAYLSRGFKYQSC